MAIFMQFTTFPIFCHQSISFHPKSQKIAFLGGEGTSANFLSFPTFWIPFTPNWLKMTHNGEFCWKSWLDWLKMVVHWDIYIFISFTCSIPLFGLISTGSEKWALFWRFRAEILISCWDIYVFVSFDRSIPLFGLISTGSEKQALFWRFHAEILISCWDIYVFVSFDHSIPLFGLISTGSEKQALFWRFHAEILISCWDIYVFVSFDHSIPLFGLISTGSEKTSPVLKVSCRNIDIVQRYLCFCKFWS